MLTPRLIAAVWLVGGIYILIASKFSPGVFGSVTAAFGIPAGVGILFNKRWAFWPAIALCFCWAGIALAFFIWADGLTFSNITLLVGAVGCGLSIFEWWRSKRLPKVEIITV